MESKSRENLLRPGVHGFLMVLVAIALIGFAIWMFRIVASAAVAREPFGLPLAAAIVSLVVMPFCFIGLTLVNPNHAKVVLLFGKYRGTIRDPGFYWINPFTARRSVSLRVRNFESGRLKVNDKLGNPIEIAAIVVWRVSETAQAILDVEDFQDYVKVQSESAIRQMATGHPYDVDDARADETSLRGSTEVINEELLIELRERLDLAGIDVLEVRLSHLAYAPEIAGAMLQRQQAEAIIAARTKIVDGAVSMVKMALDELRQSDVIELDEERRAQMVTNLLVVLCSERGTQPVLNAGTLYG